MAAVRTPSRESESRGHLDMNDLNLLQHYILHTSRKMTLHSGKSLVWERIFPDVAASKEFIMHLLLALAGLDILTADHPSDGQVHWENSTTSIGSHIKNPELNKLETVIQHHQRGLEGLQEELRGAGESNAELLVIGSMLVVGFAFASLRIRDLDPSPQILSDSIDTNSYHTASDAGRPQVHWLRLIRGVSFITQQYWITLKKSRVRTLLLFNNANDDWKPCQSELDSAPAPQGAPRSTRITRFALGARQAILNLRTFSSILKTRTAVTEDLAYPTSFPSPDSDRMTILQKQDDAITLIEDIYMRILYVLQLRRIETRSSSSLDTQAEIEEAAVTSWPHLLSQTFISSLESYESFGVIEGLSFTILVYLYLTLSILEDLWYLGTTFDKEINKIHALILKLNDNQLADLMKWPMEVIKTL